MFRLWGKIWESNRLIKDITITVDNEELNRTRKIFQAIEEICYTWDLPKPLWLEPNIAEFKRHSKTRFSKDCFIEAIDFDYLEIQVIEE